MDLSADEAAAIHFRGTRYAYDRREVDRFRERVIAALTAHEAERAAAEQRIRELERIQSHRPLRLRGRVAEESVALQPSVVPPEDFVRWHAELIAAATYDRIRAMANEEARMIRAVAICQAADEIERLTGSARVEALEVTRRAARLAGQTEEQARARADAIIDATIRNPDVDVEVLARRIDDLRAGIADVQARLAATSAPEGQVITLDLREPAVEEAKAAAAGGTRRKARRSKSSAAPTTSEVEAKTVELRERLDPD
jgi:hypothetical protein